MSFRLVVVLLTAKVLTPQGILKLHNGRQTVRNLSNCSNSGVAGSAELGSWGFVVCYKAVGSEGGRQSSCTSSR
jgi:hypothetical protein